jgi:hypothetical protein
MQRLTTIGAPPPSTPPPEENVSQQPQTLASAVILGYETGRTRDNILLSQSRESLNLEGQAPIFVVAMSTWEQPPGNTVSHSSPIVAWCHCRHGRDVFLCCALSAAMVMWPGSQENVFTELLPPNGCLCWSNHSGFQQTCHNIIFGDLLAG